MKYNLRVAYRYRYSSFAFRYKFSTFKSKYFLIFKNIHKQQNMFLSNPKEKKKKYCFELLKNNNWKTKYFWLFKNIHKQQNMFLSNPKEKKKKYCFELLKNNIWKSNLVFSSHHCNGSSVSEGGFWQYILREVEVPIPDAKNREVFENLSVTVELNFKNSKKHIIIRVKITNL